MWFFKNGAGWCQRHNPENTEPRPKKSRAPIFRARGPGTKASSAKPQAPKK